MKLDVSDKIILITSCISTIVYLLHDYKTDPKVMLILYTVGAVGYACMAVKVWRSE
jgi:hypothetical protein